MNLSKLPTLDDVDRNGAPPCRQSWRLVAGVLLLCLTSSGCGSAIGRSRGEAESCALTGDNLTGVWEGTWVSRSQGYHRTLRTTFAACGNSEYHGHYEIRIGAVIPRNYEFVHATVEQDGATCFRGEMDNYLGMSGTCHYAGRSDFASLVINYVSAKDFGVIRLHRVAVEDDTGNPQGMVDALRDLIR